MTPNPGAARTVLDGLVMVQGRLGNRFGKEFGRSNSS